MKQITLLAVLFIFFFTSPALVPAGTVLDPSFSTYLGGSENDRGLAIAVGSNNYIYVTGKTSSLDFPTTNSYQAALSDSSHTDVFVTRLYSSGTAPVFSTYFGGSEDDIGYSIAVSPSTGYIFVAGETDSFDFPVDNAYQSTKKLNTDAFLVQLSPGGTLYYSTYLGGSSYDRAYGVTVRGGDEAYVTGSSNSPDFPTVSAFQSSRPGNYDAFVTKFSASGTQLLYSTYLGGTRDDHGYGIAVDSEDNAYIAGDTESENFPTWNCYQAGQKFSDAFVTKLSSSGSSLVYSTYLGGSISETAAAIAVDSDGWAYVCGWTDSLDFPTIAAGGYRPFQSGYGGGSWDAFVTQMHSDGSNLYYSTYLGGSGEDRGRGIAVDSAFLAYVAGMTGSSDFPVAGAYQSTYGGANDAFLSRLSFHGDSLLHSTYLGGSGSEDGNGVALDSEDNICVTGFSDSSDFPVANAYQSSFAGAADAFVTKFTYQTSAPEKSYHTDFNGDGTSDIAVFRGSSGLWAIRGITRLYFGSSSDQTVPADYNGDATTDIAVYRQGSGLWAIRNISRLYFGDAWDYVVPGDYNGDGSAEAAIFRPTSGLWAVRGVTRAYFGENGDTPLPGYYDGDAVEDIALFRPSTGLWALRNISRIYFGSSGDELVPGDYSGSGSWGPSVFRPASGLWAARGVTRVYFGSSSDQPVPADYSGAGRDDFGIFRDSSGLWAVKGLTRVYFGGGSDIPVTR